MKKLITIGSMLLLALAASAQTPKMRVLFVDSAGYNQVSALYLPQVAISGYFSNIINKPTTLSGYGITDAPTTAQMNAAISAASSPISSVFGRTGGIVASSGDYSAYYVSLTGSYINPSWLVSIPNTKVTYTGTTAQYVRGDGALVNFPTAVSSFTNDAGYVGNTSNILAKSSSYSVQATDFASGKIPILLLKVDATTGNCTQTLPATGIPIGSVVKIIKTDATANTITISGVAYDNVIGTQYWEKELVFDGTTWYQN